MGVFSQAARAAIPAAILIGGPFSYFLYTRKVVNEPLNKVEFAGAYDGDTFTVNIPSLPDVFGKQIPVRIRHIDTPEKNGETLCEKRVAAEAGEALEILLANAQRIDLIDPQRDKYFRILSEVLVDKKILVSEYMLKNKLAYPYEGDTKPLVDWCKYGKQ
jgi:endonuclease YncB( thermonuclease family)